MTCYGITDDGRTVTNYAIGDWFNGMLSLASLKKKIGNTANTEIGVNPPRRDLVALFEAANFVSVEPKPPITSLHLDHLYQAHSEGHAIRSTRYFMWDYFLLRGLNEADMFGDFKVTGTVQEHITEDDVIIFPTNGGAELLNPNVYLPFVGKVKGNVYWNQETIPYRNNIPQGAKTLSLGLMDLLATLIAKKPRIIGHRSGIFDVFFHVLPPCNNQVYCVYDRRNETQMLWQFKATLPYKQVHLPKEFSDYARSRTTFYEVFV
jgi:hypothetical protein